MRTGTGTGTRSGGGLGEGWRGFWVLRREGGRDGCGGEEREGGGGRGFWG